jgi:hypothetical protein
VGNVISAILSIIPGSWLAAIGVAVAALSAMWFGGRKSAKTDAKAKDAAAYRETRERMDNAENDIADDPATLRDWLRERGKR